MLIFARIGLRSLLAILVLLAFPKVAFSASFNCHEARTILEILICSDSELSNLDGKVADLYFKVKFDGANGDTDKSLVIGEQTKFLNERTQVCVIPVKAELSEEDTTKIITCLKGYYTLRLNSLSIRLKLEDKTIDNPTAHNLPQIENHQISTNVATSKNPVIASQEVEKPIVMEHSPVVAEKGETNTAETTKSVLSSQEVEKPLEPETKPIVSKRDESQEMHLTNKLDEPKAVAPEPVLAEEPSVNNVSSPISKEIKSDSNDLLSKQADKKLVSSIPFYILVIGLVFCGVLPVLDKKIRIKAAGNWRVE